MAKKKGGAGPRRKGKRFELELVRMARASRMEAKRAWGSNGASLGLPVTVDCLIAGKRVQAKRPRAVARDLLPDDTVDAVAFRPDFGEALVVIRYADWLDLLKAAEQETK